MQNWVLCLSLGWVSLPGSHAPSRSSQQAVGKAGAQGSPAFCPHEQTSTIPSTKTTERDRDAWSKVFFFGSKTTWKTSCLSPEPSLLLHATGTAPFWWYWWDWDGVTDVTRVSKSWNISSVIRFYRIQIFNSTNTGLEDGSTGLRTGYSGQEELLLWWQNSLKALPSNYSFKDNNVPLP